MKRSRKTLDFLDIVGECGTGGARVSSLFTRSFRSFPLSVGHHLPPTTHHRSNNPLPNSNNNLHGKVPYLITAVR